MQSCRQPRLAITPLDRTRPRKLSTDPSAHLSGGSPCSPGPGQSTHHALQLWDSNPHLENTGAMQDAPTTFISSRHSVSCRGHWVRHMKLVEHCGKWPRHPGNSRHFPLLYKFFHAIISYNTNVRAKVQASHLVPQTPFGNPKLFLVQCSLWWATKERSTPSTPFLPFIVFLKITIYQTAIYS